ncbi:MAG: hypothetical protein AB7P21_03190 [Lautropia sp.]
MSTTIFSWAFPARREDVAAHMRSLDDVGHLLPAGAAPPLLLMSVSRGDWLLATVEALGQSIAGASSPSPPSLPVHLPSLHRQFTVLPIEALPEAIAEIDGVFDRARRDPAGFAAWLGQGDTAQEPRPRRGHLLTAIRFPGVRRERRRPGCRNAGARTRWSEGDRRLAGR